jgi:glycosyltransferase involved in cell wall biosynthesis
LTRQIRAVLRDLPDWPVQVWSFAPDVDYLCGEFEEECVVYYCVDEFSQFEGYDERAVSAAEARLARQADLVITTSQALHKSKAHLNDNVTLVTHGVDHAHFARARSGDLVPPADIADLPRPVLGFWGLIQDWVDVALVAELARARPDRSIVMLGEIATDVSSLGGLSNVHLLGRRPYCALPAYAKGFDVGLIPFRVNELTRSVNPIKLREYLSAGLPVVSTALPEVGRYAGLVGIARDVGEFVRSCDAAVACSGDERAAESRQEAMQGETWHAKLTQICDHVKPCMATVGGAPCGQLVMA